MRRTLLILIFLGFIPIACEQVDEYFSINDLTCEVFKNDALSDFLLPTDSALNNLVYFKINMAYDFVSYAPPIKLFDFATPLQAFSKGRPGNNGLKNKLKEIKICSSKSFNGLDVGADLKGLFKWHNIQWDGRQKPIDSLVIALNKEAFFIGESNKYFFKLILNEKPADVSQHTFSFDFIYESGNHLLIYSTIVNWKKGAN